MRKGQKMRQASKDAIRKARSSQVHPSMAARGITAEQIVEAKTKGLQWCCGDCKDFIDPQLFKDEKAPRCRECVRVKSERWRAKATQEQLAASVRKTCEWRTQNPEYDRKRDLLRKYGVTPEWYDKQFAAQRGHCALCPATSGRQSQPDSLLFVDHDHETDKPRGLLCCRCNVHLGVYEKMGLWHRMARRYLRIHKNKKGAICGANFYAHRDSMKP
jgi:hypothetical protein